MFWIGLAIGFVVGFATVCFILIWVAGEEYDEPYRRKNKRFTDSLREGLKDEYRNFKK